MSKKTSQPSGSPQPAVGDFLYRTMIERESTGKRRIRPKNVDDLDFLQSSLADESDDPDFDCKDEDSDSEGVIESEEDEDGSNDSKSEGGDGNIENAEDDSDESDDEDYHIGKGSSASSSGSDSASESGSDDNESSDEGTDNSDSDEPETGKKSALRESLQKFDDDTNIFMAKKPAKKKRKPVKPGEKSTKKPTAGKASKKSESQAKAGNKARTKSKKSESETKKVKGKKSVVVKKPKVAKKKASAEKKKKRKSPGEKSKPSIMSLLSGSEIRMLANRNEIDLNKRICSACLKDNSDESNEIVECDSCGITVHETCYGLFADNLSIASGSGSSSSTEPWFCDVCRSGADKIACELCPVEGGLFKESTAGSWVHLVCALYTPGVVVHNDSSINLYAIHYTRWGSHNCAACENERYAQTGIVISCDAGLCKTYFHATCAQKQGLLSDPVDPTQVDPLEADPYFVSCKMHTNREVMKRRIKQFNILQEQLRIKKMRKEASGLPSTATPDQARIVRKLDKIRQKTAKKRALYLQSVENVPPLPSSSSTSLVPYVASSGVSTSVVPYASSSSIYSQPSLPDSWTTKKHRMLHTSAKMWKDFSNKSKMLGDDITAEELEVKHEKIVSNIKRKWNVLPAMSVEYAAYYADRESRISSLLEQHEKSVKESHELMEQNERLTDMLETQEVNREAMEEENESVQSQLTTLANILKSILPGDKQFAAKLNKLTNVKDVVGGRRKSPSMSKGDRKSPSPRRMSAASGKKSPSRGKSAVIKVCDTCSKSDNQHLITICDKCRKNYHLGCLDPPLDRMPKRTRLCGWICSDCGDAASDDESQVDTEAPRTLRGRTKIHKPRKYRGSDDSDAEMKELTPAEQGSVVKRPKSSPKLASTAEAESISQEPLPIATSSSQKKVTKKKRASRIKSSENVVSPVNGPVPLSSGPNLDIAPETVESGVAVSLHQPEISVVDIKPDAGKKRKSPAHKTSKGHNKASINESDVITPVSPTRTTIVSPPAALRKSDGPLTSYKVNGINIEDASLPLPITPKQKQKRPRKTKGVPTILSSEDASKNGMSVVGSVPNLTVGLVKVKLTKPKKPKVRKEVLPNDTSKPEESEIPTTTVNLLSPNTKPPKKPKLSKKAAAIILDTANAAPSDVIKPAKPPKKPRVKKLKVVDGVIPPGPGALPDPVDVKPTKKSKVKKPKKSEISAGTGDDSAVGLAVQVGKPVKKPRKPKKAITGVGPGQPEAIAEQVEKKPIKVRKPRKKKEPVENIQVAEDGIAAVVIPEKKVKKKASKPRISPAMPQSAPGAEEEKNGMNEVMGRMNQITKIVVGDNMKNMQNGTAKVTKKRKSSTALVQPPANVSMATSSSDEKEKEKSVPPKKRKRAPSNAQLQQQQLQQQQGLVERSVNSVDSIIHAVSCGDAPEQALENGDSVINSPGQMSTIMRGVVPRQLAPEQNIMQGKAMGSGVNSGEMVTVDASFLLDCAPSADSNYRTSSVPTFYSSSSSQINNGSSQKESTLQVISNSGSEQNVIRLQYIEDAPASTASMPLPSAHPPVPSPNLPINGVCATCTKSDNKAQMITCDKCQLEFHFMCLNPSVKNNPRKKNHPWFCRECDDIEPMGNGIRHMQ